MKTWRQHFHPKIAKIIADNPDATYKQLKKILSDANPGPYGWQTKQWRIESKAQLSRKFNLPTKVKPVVSEAGQNKLL